MPDRATAGSETAPPNQPEDFGWRSGGKANDARPPGCSRTTKAPLGTTASVPPAATVTLSAAANQARSFVSGQANLSQPATSWAAPAGTEAETSKAASTTMLTSMERMAGILIAAGWAQRSHGAP